ncbi:hypothetical protein [Streptomyces murinus]|uniref:Cytochrome P450 n=1 Tax=Streptomyces murinus TaxID=33900 RepID=A0A7W3NKB0_STRMR|nr:hypothetical protein [Streptomyces murinus]MBA9052085.1 cytochrome P450 [Streptomyces murinus]
MADHVQLLAPLAAPIAGVQTRLEQIIDEQLTGMIEHGAPADLVEWFAQPIPARVIAEMLGLPERERPDYQSWILAMLSLDTAEEPLREARDGLYGGLAELGTARPGPATTSSATCCAGRPR